MSKQPDPYRSLREELSRIKETLRRMASASPFFGTGMHPNGNGGIDSDNFVAGVSGYSFKSDGNAEFNDLTLRGGIIGNDALTNPVVPGFLFASTTGFGLTATLAHVLTRNVTVPAGCTQLAASVTGRVFAYNDTAGLDYIYGQTNIAGFNGNALPLAVSGSMGSGTNISPFSVLLTGLTPGQNVAIQMDAQTAFAAWSANAGNTAELSGLLLWFR